MWLCLGARPAGTMAASPQLAICILARQMQVLDDVAPRRSAPRSRSCAWSSGRQGCCWPAIGRWAAGDLSCPCSRSAAVTACCVRLPSRADPCSLASTCNSADSSRRRPPPRSAWQPLHTERGIATSPQRSLPDTSTAGRPPHMEIVEEALACTSGGELPLPAASHGCRSLAAARCTLCCC